jgi:phytoene dehydrogenase-like protein
MAYMVEDFYRPGAVMEFPKGGSAELIGALERGVTKHAGSSVLTSTPVEEVLVEDGRAVGVRVKGGKTIRAKQAVVSNADLYNTFKLVPEGVHEGFDAERESLLGKGGSMKDEGVPLCKSFMHVHLGIKADAMPKDLPPQVSHFMRLSAHVFPSYHHHHS